VTTGVIKASSRRACNRRRHKIEDQSAIRLETRIFEFYHERYSNLTELAKAMGVSVSQVYRVRQGKRPISEKFITGTVKAFPGYRLDDLFHVVLSGRYYGGRQ